MVPKKDKRSKPNPLNGNTFSTSLQSNKEQNMILKRCKTMLVVDPFYSKLCINKYKNEKCSVRACMYVIFT